MWLLSTDRAELHYFSGPDTVTGGYAILSHTWEGEEQSFQDIQALSDDCNAKGLNPRDHEYLRGEGCFDLPPAHVLRDMMRMYFKMNHPNLPIVDENHFWSLWNGDEYRVGEYSYLLLRAMMFAATSVSTCHLGGRQQADHHAVHRTGHPVPSRVCFQARGTKYSLPPSQSKFGVLRM